MSTQQIESQRWLLSDQAGEYLTHAQAALSDGMDIVRLVSRLRKKISPEQTALVVEQSRLRMKAKKKFSNASSMFFTGNALEMATNQTIAAYKALRFDNTNNVADICCSIGGDLIGIAASNPSRPTAGFDSDELAVMYANANLRANDLPAIAQIKTFEELALADYAAIHIDPERRKQGRTINGAYFSPQLSEIIRRCSGHNAVAIKVAPATSHQSEYPDGIERQWIGHSRECKQQIIWTGDLATHPGCRSVVRIGKSGVTEFVCDEVQAATVKAEVAESVGQFVYEPHNAVLAASLTNAIAVKNCLARISSGVAYLTSNERVSCKLLTRFKVLKVMPANLSAVAKTIQEFSFGNVEVKKRGVPEFLAENFKRIKVLGEARGTIILTRQFDKRIAIIAKRETAS